MLDNSSADCLPPFFVPFALPHWTERDDLRAMLFIPALWTIQYGRSLHPDVLWQESV